MTCKKRGHNVEPSTVALRECAGFTLVEMLLALAIFVILAAVVCAGIPVAWRTYTQAVDTSNAQVLLSTATTSLRDELSRATDFEPVSGISNEYEYINGEGYHTKLKCTDNGIYKEVYEYNYTNFDGNGSPAVEDAPSPEGSGLLVSNFSEARIGGSNNLKVSFQSIEFDSASGVYSVNGLKVEKDSNTLASIGADDSGNVYEIKAISARGA